MRVRLFGVRGSIPWASALCIGHGCNTPCVELAATDGRRLILDAGSGLVGVGEEGHQLGASILLTHYHWDHLQGLPFFGPLYVHGATPTIWAPDLQVHESGWVETIFNSQFFPVPYEKLPARPSIRLVGTGAHAIEGFDVRATELNHPGGALAYRIRGDRGDLVYATDHELGNPSIDEKLIDFARGARLLIFDSHYTPDEAASHRNWGHSDWGGAAEFADRAGVERLWLFHHRPGRTDVDLTKIEADARAVFAETDAAREGDFFDV